MVFALRLNFGLWLSSVVLSAAALFPICLSGTLIDLLRPKLHWNNPTEAIKQNFNVVLGMVAGAIIIMALGALCYGFLQLQMNPVFLYGLVVLILAALSWAGISILRKAAVRAYRRLEG